MGLSFVVSCNVLINTQLHAIADKWLYHMMQCTIYLLRCKVIDRLSKIIRVRSSLFNKVVSFPPPPPLPNLIHSQRGTTCKVRPTHNKLICLQLHCLENSLHNAKRHRATCGQTFLVEFINC